MSSDRSMRRSRLRDKTRQDIALANGSSKDTTNFSVALFLRWGEKLIQVDNAPYSKRVIHTRSRFKANPSQIPHINPL